MQHEEHKERLELNYLRDPKDVQYQDVLVRAEKHDPI